MTTEFAPSCRMHHIGIQVGNFANSLAWYRDFFGARETWSTSEFSPLTVSRLPGVTRLVELAIDDLRLHLFERAHGGEAEPYGNRAQFQHVCLTVSAQDEVARWRQRWLELYHSGAYTFACADQPSEIVRDHDGTESFYCLDVNGLEFEFTFLPEGVR